MKFSAMLAMAAPSAYAQSVVLGEDFEGAEFPPSGWSLLDKDGDGKCWIGYSGNRVDQVSGSKKLAVSFLRDPSDYSAYEAQDNWLITPAVTISNNAHVLEFKYAAQDIEHAEPLEVLISETGTAAEDFTTFYSEKVDNGYMDDIEIYSFSRALGEYAGKTIHIAFRHQASGTYGLSVDNVFVYNQLGPAKPTGFTAKAGDNGALSATLSWTNPSKTANGQALTELSILVYRDDELVATIDDVALGQAATWTDNAAPAGTHKYAISAKNAEGETPLSAVRSVFIGEDVPAAAKDLMAMAIDGKITLTWTAPTTGANKGFVNLDNLTYTVSRTVGGTTSTVATGVTGTAYTDDAAPEGKMCVYSVVAVNSAGSSAVDGYSSAIIYGDALADMGVAQTTERNNSLKRLPVDLTDKTAVSQTIYTPDDLRFLQGDITALVYRAFRGMDSDLTFPVRIYIAPTGLSDLTAGYADMSDAKEVYKGEITLGNGTRDIEIALTEPYAYQGGNIIVTFIKDSNPNGSYADRFISLDLGGAPRSFMKYVSGEVDITSLPTPGYSDKAVSEAPSTRFIISPKNIGSLSGKVTDSATGRAVAGATVSVPAYAGMTVTTDAEGAYSLRYVPVAANRITVTAPGYEDADVAVDIADGKTTVKDVAMKQLANYALSGSIIAGDTRKPAAGAVVRLAGYEEAAVTADAEGRWKFDAVYSGKDYTLSIEYPLYDVFTVEINNTSETEIAVGTTELQRSLIPAYGLDAAVAADGSSVALTWLDPLSRDGETGWKSVGDISEIDSNSGDYSSTDYNVGHYYGRELIAAKNMTGLSIGEIKVYLKASAGTFVAKVWKGTRDNNVELAAQTIPAELVTEAGSWVTVKLDNPVEIKKDTDYIVGVQCLNASKYPLGTAKRSTETGGNNQLKWAYDDPYVYDGYYPWCIMANCIVPGTEVAIADNPDAPRCAYNVYRSTAKEGEWEKLTSSPVNEMSFTDEGWASLVSGRYLYAVSAVYLNGESAKATSDSLSRSNDIDAGVTAFVSPLKSVDMRNSVSVTVTVTNFGEKPLTGFPVSVKLNDAAPVSKTFDGTINKGESADITIADIELTEGVHTFTAYTSVEGDQTPANDACSQLIPNISNVELTGYRWSAYGNAGFMKIQSNDPESADFLREVTPNDALVIAGECVDGRFYGYTATWYGMSRQFVEIDPVTWTVQRAVDNADDYILDMAYDYSTSTMYAIRPDGDNANVELVKVNTGDGTVEAVGSVGFIVRALACNVSGRLYAIGDDGNLYTINPATAEPDLVGATGVTNVKYLQSMAFDHNTGRLFWAHTGDSTNGAIHEVDAASGKATLLGSTLFNKLDEAEIVGLYTPYKHQSSAISSVGAASDALVLSADELGNVTVDAPAGGVLTVYSAAGAAVATHAFEAGRSAVALGVAHGVYVVSAKTSAATATLKVAVR